MVTHYAYTNINDIIKKASNTNSILGISLSILNSRLNYAEPVKTAEIHQGICSPPQAATNNSRATLFPE